MGEKVSNSYSQGACNSLFQKRDGNNWTVSTLKVVLDVSRREISNNILNTFKRTFIILRNS